MNWKPLLDEKDTGIYRDKLSEIASILLEKAPTLEHNNGVMGGKAGITLFFFYYANLMMEEKYVDAAHQLINDMFDSVNNATSIHTFAGGLAGVGWMMEHLVQNDFVDADTDEILESLDPFLHKAMIYDIEKGNFDYLHGAAGTGAYFLNRLAKKESAGYLEELVDHLDKLGHRQDDGSIAWESTLDHEKGNRGYNLSLSHGISSLIVFYAKLLEKNICPEKVKPLLDGAVKYLLDKRLDVGQFNCHFPSWISPEYPVGGSRMAWCYGDLGIGVTLWQAGHITGNKEWQDIAVDVLLHSTQRRDLKENSVVDAGLCHGAAGMGHIYNRMYQHTGREEFKETALYWFDATLKMATHDDGFAGYKAWHTEKYGGWKAEVGLLEGITGIGLSLISLVSEMEPRWDFSLFLS